MFIQKKRIKILLNLSTSVFVKYLYTNINSNKYLTTIRSPHKIEIKTPSKINLIKIGKRIKEARSELYLTLREIGKKLNCSYSAFAAYERGENLINSETLLSLCTLTNYSIDYILGRTNTKYLNK